MLRNAIIAVSACVYIGLSAWLVGRQGRAYREGLRHDRPADEQAAKPQERQPEPKNDVPKEAVALNTETKSHPAREVAAVEPTKTHNRDQASPAATPRPRTRGSDQARRLPIPLPPRRSHIPRRRARRTRSRPTRSGRDRR